MWITFCQATDLLYKVRHFYTEECVYPIFIITSFFIVLFLLYYTCYGKICYVKKSSSPKETWIS